MTTEEQNWPAPIDDEELEILRDDLRLGVGELWPAETVAMLIGRIDALKAENESGPNSGIQPVDESEPT